MLTRCMCCSAIRLTPATPVPAILSTDNGQHWTRVGDQRGELQFSPYLPLQLLGRNGTTLSVLDVGNLGTGMTVARPALCDQGYAPETGQTISPLFMAYWQRNGGLARFEYHPENHDPQYQVLLGLLGNDLLRAKGWLE